MSADSGNDDSLYPIAVLIDELRNEDVQVWQPHVKRQFGFESLLWALLSKSDLIDKTVIIVQPDNLYSLVRIYVPGPKRALVSFWKMKILARLLHVNWWGECTLLKKFQKVT